MDGRRGDRDSERVGTHSAERMETESGDSEDTSRDLFYPWRYLSTEAMIEYWSPDGTIYPAGWSRGLGGRHSRLYQSTVYGRPERETVAMMPPTLRVSDRWL